MFSACRSEEGVPDGGEEADYDFEDGSHHAEESEPAASQEEQEAYVPHEAANEKECRVLVSQLCCHHQYFL